MANPELLGQVKQFAASGQGRESIKKILTNSGWDEAEVEAAIEELGGEKLFLKQKESEAFARPGAVEIPIIKSRVPFRILAAALGVIVFGGGIFAFYFFQSKSSDGILASAVKNLIESRSFRYDAKGKLDFKIIGSPNPSSSFLGFDLDKIAREQGNELSLIFDAGGYSDLQAKNQPKVSAAVNFKFSGDKSADVLMSGEAVALGEKIYFRITKAGGGAGFLEDSPIINQWVEGDSISKEVGAVLPLSSLRRDVFNKLLGDDQFLKAEEKLPEENVEGAQAYHFSLGIDQNIFWKFLSDWIDPKTADGLRSEFRDRYDVLGKIEIWIDKKVNVPVRMLVNGEIKDKKGVWSLALNWDTLYSKFGEPTVFSEITAAELQSEWKKNFLRAFDDRRVSNLRGVQELLGKYFNKCGFYPGPANCASGFKKAPSSWNELLGVLKGSGFETKGFEPSFDSESIYQYGSDGRNYMIGVKLSDASYPALGAVLGGRAFGVSCDHAILCVSSFWNQF